MSPVEWEDDPEDAEQDDDYEYEVWNEGTGRWELEQDDDADDDEESDDSPE